MGNTNKSPTSDETPNNAGATAAAAPSSEFRPSEPEPADQTLDEFCTHLSITDKRVEMIGAFHSVERQAGRSKDLASAYASRYQSFCNKPV